MKRSRRAAYGLVLFPLLVVGGQTLVQHSLSRAQSAGAEIHLAGRQLYLMERIGRHAPLALQGEPSATRALRADVAEWTAAHNALLDGDQARKTRGVQAPAARASLDSLTPFVRGIAAATAGSGGAAAALPLIRDGERAFVPAMNRVAAALDDAAAQRILRLRRMIGIVGVSLVAAAVMAGLLLLGGGGTERAPPSVRLAAPAAPAPRRTTKRKVPGLLTGARWTVSLGAVVILGMWPVLDVVGSGEYTDPLWLRVACAGVLVAAGAATFHRRFTLRALRPVAVGLASGALGYQAWLAAINGLDAVWIVSALTMGAALAITLGPYARVVREVWTGQACLLAALSVPLFLFGAPADKAALTVACYVALLITTGFAGVVFVHTRQALRDGRESLRERSQLLRTVIDAIPEHIFVKDLDGRCVIRNQFSCDFLGMADPSEAVGLTTFSTSTYHLAEAYWDLEKEVMETGRAMIEREEACFSDGRPGWMVSSRIPLRNGDGRVIGLVGVTRDVTDQKAAEAEVRAQSALTRAILEAVPDALLTVDADDVVLDANASVADVLGVPPGQLVGRRLSDVAVPARYRDEHRAKLRRYVTEGHVGSLGRLLELPFLRADGVEVPASVTIRPIDRADGDPVFLVYIADLSAQKAAHDALVASRDAAEAATRAKSEFLATMSHEIRTPMNGVIGMTSLLGETALDADQEDYVRTIRSSGESLLTVINDILDFSKVEAGQLALEEQSFDVRRAVEDTADLFAQAAADAGTRLTWRVADAVPASVEGDVTRLRQVLANLVSNALKFTDGGTVEVRVSGEDAGEGRVTLGVEVEDTGIGIAPDKLEAVFDSFVQADASTTRTHGGTGLGLAISARLVEMMDGEISVTSELGVGSTFRFTIRVRPSAKPAGDGAAGAPARVSPPRSRRALRVLLVEDNVVNQKVAVRLLGKLGLAADVVSDGVEAVENTGRQDYDVVLMDVQMPRMDGLDATRAIRSRDRHQPYVIMLTANAMEGDRERCLEAGADRYLSKPITLEALGAAVDAAEEGRVPLATAG